MKKLQVKTNFYEIYSAEDNNFYTVDLNRNVYSEFFTEELLYNILQNLYFNNLQPLYMSEETIQYYNQLVKNEEF